MRVAFVDACVEAGVPVDLVQLVHGGPGPAAALATHTGVGAVSFTGSVATGRKVAAAAMAVGPKVVSLELGGKNAMVVLDDADLDLVLEGALFGAFGTSGQRCTSTSRLIVQRGVAAEVVDQLAERAAALRLGDPLDAERRHRPGDHAAGRGADRGHGGGCAGRGRDGASRGRPP